MLLVPGRSEQLFLEKVLGVSSSEGLMLRLYKNERSPTDDDVALDYEEADFAGYEASPLWSSAWKFVLGGPTVATHPEVLFQSAVIQAVQRVYGYVVTGERSGDLYWAERFMDGPYEVKNKGDQILVTPKLCLD